MFSKNLSYLILLLCTVFVLFSEAAFCSDVVRVVQHKDGVWLMTVNNKPYFIKGMVYSAEPVGTAGPDVNDWMWYDLDKNEKPDGPYDSWVDLNRDNYQDISENIVGDFALLKAMGCNTIRIYHSEKVNKELLSDLYRRFGIRVIMGNFFGAYTRGSNASWHAGTDYTDRKQKKNMLENVRKMVEEFKNEPYVLMWMLGNENDLEGSYANSTKNNTNAGKRPEAYAKFIEETCKMIKELDPNHPVGVCNGSTKLLKYFAEYAPSIDVLGFNQYNGPYGFGTLWNRVKQEFDRPVLITEYGCDAWNETKKMTNEAYQANYHKTNWKDIENNSYWGDKNGNSIGGVVFCWLDRWWLVGSAKVHDTMLGAWKGSTIDGWFNDEWQGICSQGSGRKSPFQRVLRRVYYTYQEELWDWNPATY